jgi:peptidoglycan/xylan/chitin deacetylase (PgdA/CDA1 family)
MIAQHLLARARHGCARRAARWLCRRPYRLPRGRAIVSFTFDDFPRSALYEGGRILERFGAAGTYYVSLGLAGQPTPCGPAFEPEDLTQLVARGHELGCHTYAHCPAWTTRPAVFEAEILRNAAALDQHLPGTRFRTLSYPISCPRPDTKRRMSRHFECCRGGGQTYNAGNVDVNHLAAFFLEQCSDQPDVVYNTLAENATAGGWLIVATHDVSERPTRFGCTPGFFEQVVQRAVDSGAEILPVAEAYEVLRRRTQPE